MQMKRIMALLAVMMLFSAHALCEGPFTLPMDFSGGYAPQKENYLSETEYEDPSIHVIIESGRYRDCDYWVATIQIADASQLRTVAADGFDGTAVKNGTTISKYVNAVLAIDGDYFSYTGYGKGIVLRQGQLFRDMLCGDRDVLLIDEDGNFHTLISPGPGEIGATIEGKKIINALCFGPVLVKDGQAQKDHPVYDDTYGAFWPRQRMALCQTGELSYKCICCGPPARNSTGMTLNEFADFVASMGVETAYNLDGGDSTMLIFNNQKINDIRNPSTRKISDIVYFASSYSPEMASIFNSEQ